MMIETLTKRSEKRKDLIEYQIFLRRVTIAIAIITFILYGRI